MPVSVPLGQASPEQLIGLAALLRRHGLDEIRTVQDQNLVIRNVPAGDVEAVVAGIEALGLGLPQPGDNVVACPGTSTCRLGITASQSMGARLANIAGDLRVRVSGCHNGCAQPETGDIGIYGEGRRMHDRLVPHYQLYLGGDGMGGGRLARKGPSVPVARIEAALSRIGAAFREARAGDERFFDWVHRQADDYFPALLADLAPGRAGGDAGRASRRRRRDRLQGRAARRRRMRGRIASVHRRGFLCGRARAALPRRVRARNGATRTPWRARARRCG